MLFGVGELRVRLGGVSRQRVDQLTRRVDFPCPCAELAQGRVWLGEDIESWIKEYKRAARRWDQGRPAPKLLSAAAPPGKFAPEKK